MNTIQLDTSKRAARMIEAGRVTITFRSPTGTHITILAKARGTNDAGKWIATDLAEAKILFFEVPNDGGWNDKVGKYTDGRGFQPDRNADPARVYCAKALLDYIQGKPTAPGLEIAEEERCGRCGRQLTDPVSIERGIGPECYGKVTGSTHETKTRPGPDARLGGTHRDGSTVVLTDQPKQDGGNGVKAELYPSIEAAEEAITSGAAWSEVQAKPKKSSRPTRRERRPDEKPAAKIYHETCNQQTTLPGTTFEDIFRARADHLGIELRS